MGTLQRPIARYSPVARNGFCNDSGGVGEVDQPSVRGRFAHSFADLEDGRNGPYSLGKSREPGGLLADEPVFHREFAVEISPELASDAYLGNYKVSAGYCIAGLCMHLDV